MNHGYAHELPQPQPEGPTRLTPAELLAIFDRPSTDAHLIENAGNEEYLGIVRYLVNRNSHEH
jgi:hypothetical protein